jgi:TRAP-type C4-dicarboxylate transport system permease small subunit
MRCAYLRFAVLKRLGQIELAICVLLLAAITGLVFVAAILRFFGHPLTWSVDMAQLLFIWLCMLGATRAMRQKTHLGMEILAKRLSYRNQFLVETVCSVIILAFLAALTIEGFRLTIMNSERTFGDSTLSYSWVTAAVPAGCVFLGIALLYNMVDAWRRRREGVLVYTRTPAESVEPEPIDL